MYLYPSRLVERLLPVRVRVVDSALSEFVSGFLTHVLMAIKEFSVFGILSPPELFVLFTRNGLSRIRNLGFCGFMIDRRAHLWHLREIKTVYSNQFF